MENVKDGIKPDRPSKTLANGQSFSSKPGRPLKNRNNVPNLSQCKEDATNGRVQTQKELEDRNNVPAHAQTGGEIRCWSI